MVKEEAGLKEVGGATKAVRMGTKVTREEVKGSSITLSNLYCQTITSYSLYLHTIL